MRQCHSCLHAEHLRIERAETHRACKKFDGGVGVTAHRSEKATQEPGCRQIWVEHQRLVDERDAGIQLAGEMSKRMSAPRECYGIVLAQFHREVRQSNAFRDFLRPIGHQAIYLPPEMTPGGHCMGRSKLPIELHGLVE